MSQHPNQHDAEPKPGEIDDASLSLPEGLVRRLKADDEMSPDVPHGVDAAILGHAHRHLSKVRKRQRQVRIMRLIAPATAVAAALALVVFLNVRPEQDAGIFADGAALNATEEEEGEHTGDAMPAAPQIDQRSAADVDGSGTVDLLDLLALSRQPGTDPQDLADLARHVAEQPDPSLDAVPRAGAQASLMEGASPTTWRLVDVAITIDPKGTPLAGWQLVLSPGSGAPAYWRVADVAAGDQSAFQGMIFTSREGSADTAGPVHVLALTRPDGASPPAERGIVAHLQLVLEGPGKAGEPVLEARVERAIAPTGRPVDVAVELQAIEPTAR